MVRRPRWSPLFPSRRSSDLVWTLQAARDPATGYPRFTDLESVTSVAALDDSTVELRFTGASVARSSSARSEEHTSELQSRLHLVCRLLLEKKKPTNTHHTTT